MHRMLSLCLCMLLSLAAMALAGETSSNGQLAGPQPASESEIVARAASKTEEVQEAEAAREEVPTAAARETNGAEESEAKEMSGMSIVGNDEAPKSLYIVPWKSSEIGVQTTLDTTLNEGDVPVDREVFKRQIKFYLVSTNK